MFQTKVSPYFQAIALLDSVQFEEMKELMVTKNNLSLVPAAQFQQLPQHRLTRLEFTHCSLGALHLLPLFASHHIDGVGKKPLCLCVRTYAKHFMICIYAYMYLCVLHVLAPVFVLL